MSLDAVFYGMDAIGRKSKSAYRSAFAGGIIGIIFISVFMTVLFKMIIPEFDDFPYFFVIIPVIMLIACVAGIIRGIMIMRMPGDLVFIGDERIGLAKPEASIMLSEVEAVFGDNAAFTHTNSHGASYTTVERYGSIVIRTKDGQRYVQKYVDQVQEVAQILNNRIIIKNR